MLEELQPKCLSTWAQLVVQPELAAARARILSVVRPVSADNATPEVLGDLVGTDAGLGNATRLLLSSRQTPCAAQLESTLCLFS